MALASITSAVEALARGEIIIVVDDENRENEGDLILACEFATPEKIAFVTRYCSGLICAPVSNELADRLELPLMVEKNTDTMKTAFTVSVDVISGISTGISAADRALTLNALADSGAQARHFSRPGHIFPLRARKGGVFVRPGHTEASVDLMEIAGLSPAAVICEVVNDDGTMARMPDLELFARTHGLLMISIEQLIAYRRAAIGQSLLDQLQARAA